MSTPNQWRHSEECETSAIAALRRDPSSRPACTCGLDEARSHLAQPTITDVLRYADSDEGRRDCEMRTELKWCEGNPTDRAEWFERLVRNFASGTILQRTEPIDRVSRDFRLFWESDRFESAGTPDDACEACGAPRKEHSSDAPHEDYRNGCPGFVGGPALDEDVDDLIQELSDEDRARPEAKLLAALRSRCEQLEEIQRRIEPNKGALEDCVYRFWHQSFKVEYARVITRDITLVLAEAALETGTELNPWYQEIVDAQALFRFDYSMNEDWPKHTRPVIDAFLHTTWLLGAILRTLSQPPHRVVRGILSYDWATIQCVFKLR